jgi:hypothetical protein
MVVPSLPEWHRDLTSYINLIGTHGPSEDDRPSSCPACKQSHRKPHRHSHYWRTVLEWAISDLICIFRFRCPECLYVHSVIPTFLEPYQQTSLDTQEAKIEAIQQGETQETVAEASELEDGEGVQAPTLSRWLRSWKARLLQVESGMWRVLLARFPHVPLPRGTCTWTALRTVWYAVHACIPALRGIGFLQGLNRLHLSMTVTAHAQKTT